MSGVKLIEADRKKPKQHIFNVGNREAVSVKDWVKLCYRVTGKTAKVEPIFEELEQRLYFSFYDYEYYLDVSAQYALMPETRSLEEGLRESYAWYEKNAAEVKRRPYMEYIDMHLQDLHKG